MVRKSAWGLTSDAPFGLYIRSTRTEGFKQRLQMLQELDSVDPWGLDDERRLHIRLSAQLWSELHYMLPECSVAIQNVEEFVQKGEKEMFNNTRLGADWFESYVSKMAYSWHNNWLIH